MVYKHAATPHRQEELLNQQLQKMTYELMHKLVLEGFTTDFSDYISHYVMFIQPDDMCEMYSLDFPTAHIYQRVHNALSTNKFEAVAWLYNMFVKVPITRGSTGYMLEDAVSDIFPKGGEWTIVPLVPPNCPAPRYMHWKNPTSMQDNCIFPLVTRDVLSLSMLLLALMGQCTILCHSSLTCLVTNH
jgi:hypothetical protein